MSKVKENYSFRKHSFRTIDLSRIASLLFWKKMKRLFPERKMQKRNFATSENFFSWRMFSPFTRVHSFRFVSIHFSLSLSLLSFEAKGGNCNCNNNLSLICMWGGKDVSSSFKETSFPNERLPLTSYTWLQYTIVEKVDCSNVPTSNTWIGSKGKRSKS
jgi:hypothetical protein